MVYVLLLHLAWTADAWLSSRARGRDETGSGEFKFNVYPAQMIRILHCPQVFFAVP